MAENDSIFFRRTRFDLFATNPQKFVEKLTTNTYSTSLTILKNILKSNFDLKYKEI